MPHVQVSGNDLHTQSIIEHRAFVPSWVRALRQLEHRDRHDQANPKWKETFKGTMMNQYVHGTMGTIQGPCES